MSTHIYSFSATAGEAPPGKKKGAWERGLVIRGRRLEKSDPAAAGEDAWSGTTGRQKGG